MLTLTQKTLNNIKRILLKKQQKLADDIKGVSRDDPLTSDGLAESSEPGTDSWLAEQHTKALALGGNLKNMALSVRKALQKIKDGTYGHCEECGKHIETRRLLAMPTASLCLSCSQKATK